MGRIERVLSWFVLVMAVGTIVVSILEVDRRADEDEVAQPPTALPSPVLTPVPSTLIAGAASPGVTESPAETQPLPAATTAGAGATAATAQPTATVAPPRTPTPAPIVPTPTPRVGATGVEPMPKTGGGALFGGAIVTVMGLLLSYFARRAY